MLVFSSSFYDSAVEDSFIIFPTYSYVFVFEKWYDIIIIIIFKMTHLPNNFNVHLTYFNIKKIIIFIIICNMTRELEITFVLRCIRISSLLNQCIPYSVVLHIVVRRNFSLYYFVFFFIIDTIIFISSENLFSLYRIYNCIFILHILYSFKDFNKKYFRKFNCRENFHFN